jgi:hypothetical protein
VARQSRIYYVVCAARKAGQAAWKRRPPQAVKTKKSADEEIAAWKAQYEGLGWNLQRFMFGYLATNSETGEERSICFHEYDAETHDHLWSHGNSNYRLVLKTSELVITAKEKRATKPAAEPATPKPRRGRKPAYA